jgi:formylglycine-generating enzyme required for sulfatase activity
LVGGAWNGQLKRAAWVRIDSFGNSTCKAAGDCFKRSQKSCDDGKPCTVDACDVKTGKCTNTAAVAGAGCNSAGVCIKGGQCVADKPGMVYIPGGVFWQGCNPWLYPSKCPALASPQRKADVAPFWINRAEVSYSEYKDCFKAGKCGQVYENDKGCNPTNAKLNPGKAKLPVNCAHHVHASDYCNWLGGRLPTEAEWEKAARGGCALLPDGANCQKKMPTFPWGEGLGGPCQKWSATSVCGKLSAMQPGGSVPSDRSPYGLLDMAGNLSEWLVEIGPPEVGDYAKAYSPKIKQCDVPKCDYKKRGAYYGTDKTYESSTHHRDVGSPKQQSHHLATGIRCVVPVP